MPLPRVHLLTCPQRAAICAETLARWARTDWPGAPRVHRLTEALQWLHGPAAFPRLIPTG